MVLRQGWGKCDFIWAWVALCCTYSLCLCLYVQTTFSTLLGKKALILLTLFLATSLIWMASFLACSYFSWFFIAGVPKKGHQIFLLPRKVTKILCSQKKVNEILPTPPFLTVFWICHWLQVTYHILKYVHIDIILMNILLWHPKKMFMEPGTEMKIPTLSRLHTHKVARFQRFFMASINDVTGIHTIYIWCWKVVSEYSNHWVPKALRMPKSLTRIYFRQGQAEIFQVRPAWSLMQNDNLKYFCLSLPEIYSS